MSGVRREFKLTDQLSVYHVGDGLFVPVGTNYKLYWPRSLYTIFTAHLDHFVDHSLFMGDFNAYRYLLHTHPGQWELWTQTHINEQLQRYLDSGG